MSKTRTRKKRVHTEAQVARSRECQRIRRALDPEKYRKIGRKAEHKRRLRRYGLTEELYSQMWLAQGEMCAICKIKENNCLRAWHLDHCHTSLRVRGILCHHCNLMLGHAKDNPAILEAGVMYLKEYACQNAT